MLDSALFYGQLGYAVFPCRPNEKRPATAHGVKDATADVGQIRQWWTATPGANIGLPTDGLLVIDVDGADNPWPAEADKQRDLLAAGAIATTPRGGRHYVFKQPAGEPYGNSAGRIAPGVDTRADGGYILVEPSTVDGKGYKWLKQLDERRELPEPPTWLRELLKPKVGPVAAAVLPALPASSDEIERRAAAYLDAMPPAISGQGGHNATFAAATAMVHGFGLPEGVALALLRDRYNPRCVPEWSEGELMHKVKSAARTTHERPYRWLLDEGCAAAGNGVDFSGFIPLSLEESPVAAPQDLPIDPGELPKHLLTVPGFIGEVVEHNLAGAFCPQPTLALGCALPMLGTLCGRKIADEQDTRTNLYCIGVAATSQGKERGRMVNKDLLYAAGLDRFIGPESFASATGLVSAVDANPAIIFQLDEIGRYLKTTSDAGSPHLFNIVTVLMRLFTSAASVYVSDAYADPKKNRKIYQPCASVWGTTTPNAFMDSLTTGSIADGFLGRVLVFEGDDVDSRAIIKPAMPASLIDAAKWWGAFNPGGNLASVNPQPFIVPSSADARRVMAELRTFARSEQKRLGEPLGDLWPRAVEKANKLALLWACSANRERPIIDVAAATWASELVRYLTARLVFLASRWVSENRVESMVKRCQRIIEAAGPGGIDGTALCRKTQFLTQRERDEYLSTLQRSGLVTVQERKTATRPGYVYTAVPSVAS